MKAVEKFGELESIMSPFADVSVHQLDPAVIADLLVGIQRAVRKRLRVSLRPDDGSPRNQDALELVHDAWMKLQHRLENGGPVQNSQAYAYLTAKNLCWDYLRRQSPQHRSLRDSALRFLRITPGLVRGRLMADGSPASTAGRLKGILQLPERRFVSGSARTSRGAMPIIARSIGRHTNVTPGGACFSACLPRSARHCGSTT